MLQLLPSQVVSMGTEIIAGARDATAYAARAVGTAASVGLSIAVLPVQVSAKVLSGEASRSTLTRHCWRGDDRVWIEVRGLSGPDGAEIGRVALEALRSQPGVRAVRLNHPLCRAVVEIDNDKASVPELCSALDDAENHCGPANSSDIAGDSTHGASLPGDRVLAAARVLVGANAAGLAIAVAGRVLRLPSAPISLDALAAIANYQPWLRRVLADRIGTRPTDAVLTLVTIGAHTLTLSPVKLSVELMMQAFKAAEYRAAAQAWARYEPELARYADQPAELQATRPVPLPGGPADRYGKRMALAQLIGTGLIGATTGNTDMAANAALAASPKAMRTTHEAFAATLGQGLADSHGVLPLRSDSLRRLNKIDALLIDPRVLCGEKHRVVRLRGAGNGELPSAWIRAQALLDQPDLDPGWHPVPGEPMDAGGVEALILPAPDPLASAVMARARDSGAYLVSIDVDTLGELRPAFDDIRPAADGAGESAIDQALTGAVAELQQRGHTVAVLSSTGAQALSSADVALGIMLKTGSQAPWNADLMFSDLAGVWRVLNALPVAKQACQQGIAIATGASTLAALFMVPGVRRGRRGPGPVTVGAAAGILSGYLLARRVLRAPVPNPAPAYEWHAMPVERVREVLPAPDLEMEPLQPATSSRGARLTKPLWQFAKAVHAELTGDPLTPVLALCSAATAVLGSPTDAVLVGAVLTGNAMLATAQQLRAESRLNRLLAQQIPPARLVMAGPEGVRSHREVVIERLRPGDVIEVRSNEVVPADARVIAEQDLEVDESALTGESVTVQKQVEATPGAELPERYCMLYAGTTVVAGIAVALVTAVGADTQTRRAAELAAGDLPTVGLQHQLGQLMSRAFPLSAGGGALVGLLGLFSGGGARQALSNAIAVAVAAVPEGMPLMATLAQHASAQRLGKSGALVRVPRAAEALGRVEVVCFDKTGTLSQNRLRVTRVHPVSDYSRDDVLHCAVHAAPVANGDPHVHATDQAIIEAASGNGLSASPQPDSYLPFRSGRAFSAAVSGTQLTVKGAPEVVLAACRNVGDEVGNTVAELTSAGLRVIAVAQRRLSAQQVRSIPNNPGRITELCGDGLTLTGLLGLSDTPRPQAPQLLADLVERGIDIRLITGDHPVTAIAIAAELGVRVSADQVITGTEWNSLSRKEQLHTVSERVIFARMSPENKVQIVQTLERSGRVTAMVGDGANDAAAIRAASVGIGVVARGSDAAHTTADVVLTDGHIEALVDAIDEGRRLWRGVQAAVSGLLGGNAGEVIFAVIGSALSGNSPLNTRQLLLMNMLTDALPATAVAVSTPAGPVQRAVHGLDEDALRRAVAVRGAITAAAATAAWMMASITGRRPRASTVALISLVTVELGQTLVDSHAPLVLLTTAGLFAAFVVMVNTPILSQLLGCTPIGPIGWAQGLGTAAVAIAAVAVTNRLRAIRRDGELPSGDASVPKASYERPTAERTTALPEDCDAVHEAGSAATQLEMLRILIAKMSVSPGCIPASG